MRPTAFLLLVLALVSAPTAAAPLYTLGVNNGYLNSWSVPSRLDSVAHTVTPGSTGTVANEQYATRDEVGGAVNALTTWTGYGGGDNFTVWPRAYNDDFVIDGPGSYVSGTLYVRFRAYVGGSNGESGCRADVMPWITIGPNDYIGTFRATNLAGYPPYQCSGILAGAKPVGDIDTVLAITKTWPVNTPFSIQLAVIVTALTSVSSANPTASWWGNCGGLGAGSPSGGLSLGNLNGVVMALPQYYTLRSTNWHIANNQRDGTADVSGPAPATRGFALAGVTPNPAIGGRVSVSFALPDGSPATLELLDVAGRRIATRDVGALGAGTHAVELAPASRLAPGLYLVRLSRGGEQRVTRVSVID